MNPELFIGKASEKGFDTVAALSIDEAEAAINEWKKYIREGDFTGHIDTGPRKILPGAKALLLLAYPYRTYKDYPGGVGRVSGYYAASNRAYFAADELTDMLRGNGIKAVRSHRLPQKPLALAAGLGRYGRNGILVRCGSHFVISTILADIPFDLPRVNADVPDCDSCGACEAACPTGCLADGHVNAGRCLRTYMTHNTDDIPDDMRPLMGERLIGCDECLNACPGMTQDPVPEEFTKLFAWEALTDTGRFNENKPAIASLIGSNNVNCLKERALKRLGGRQIHKMPTS